jgi:hydroxymethylpyrimidine pyrophosphatase-like HAD family hydrolase
MGTGVPCGKRVCEDRNMRPRLIATDLDGTLLDREQGLTPRTVAAVRAVVAAGIEFVLVTARPPRTVAHLAEQLGGGIAALCGNGTILAEFGAPEVPGAPGVQRTLDADAPDTSRVVGAGGEPEPDLGLGSARGAITLIRAFEAADAVAVVKQLRPVLPEAGFALETGFEVYFETAFRIGSVADHRRILTDELTGIAPQMRSIIKVLARSPERSADEMVALARETLSVDAEISHSGGRGLLEIAPSGASKASALAWLCARRGIAADSVAAFGDMPNDLPMLRWAGVGHAVANAHPDVLAAAHRVVGHHAQDGVALALEAMLDSV